jgi:hypothetical protein
MLAEFVELGTEKGPLVGVGRTAEVYAWGDRQILKPYRMGMPEHWVRHEARVARVVSAAGLHVPAIGGSATVITTRTTSSCRRRARS